MSENVVASNENQVMKQRREKAEFLQQAGLILYPNDFKKEDKIGSVLDKYSTWNTVQLEEKEAETKIVVAGRIMALRSFGRVAFFHMQDQSGQIQVYAQRELLGKEAYQFFKKFDVGDIVGVSGTLFRTKTDELTIKAESIRLLSKSMRPLPEKYHGLKDVETRYRQRYVDLIVTPKSRMIFERRTAIVRFLRNFLDTRGFMEVETPMMQAIPGGAAARPFITHHNALNIPLYLRIAPELYLKRLLVGGFEKVYEINRNFRNEGVDTTHNPEFTMLEFYWAYARFQDLMDLTEELFSSLASEIVGFMIL